MARQSQENLKLQQFRCPSCDQNITQLTPFKASIECPYCHQVSLNPLVVDKSILVPQRVIPFSVSKDEFGEQIIEALVDEDNLPLDLFDQITFGSVIKAFLPMYEYAGTFEGTWNCEEGYQVERKKRQGNSTVTVRETRYRPASGNAYGNFSILALAYSGNDIPPEFERYAAVIPNDGENSYPFDPELMGLNSDEQIVTLEMNLDPRHVWADQGDDYVAKLAHQACLKQAPKNHRKFRDSYRVDVEDEGIYTMVPFWFVYFYYEGKSWNFMTEGSGSWNHLSAPQSAKIPLIRWSIVGFFVIIGFVLSQIQELNLGLGGLAIGVIGALLGYFGYNLFNRVKRIAGACRAFPESNFAKKHRS